jgi:hypothetical protein
MSNFTAVRHCFPFIEMLAVHLALWIVSMQILPFICQWLPESAHIITMCPMSVIEGRVSVLFFPALPSPFVNNPFDQRGCK